MARSEYTATCKYLWDLQEQRSGKEKHVLLNPMSQYFYSPLLVMLMLMFFASTSLAEKNQTLGLLVGISGLGDQSFNDMTYAGLIKVKQEHNLKLIIEDSEKSDAAFETAMQRLIDKGAYIIIANDFYLKGLVEKFAKRYPDHFFILQDGSLTGLPNVISILYSAHEGSFLAGALAGMMTRSDKVGFLGGVDIPVIHGFQEGFRQGVQYTNPRVEVREEFISKPPDFSGFKQPAIAYAHATKVYNEGIDIIYVAAGLSGNGVMQAAKDSGKFAIGVDSDQDHLAKGSVLTSMMKRLDIATYIEVNKIIEGDAVPGVKIYGLKERGVGLSEMKFTREIIPPDTLRRLDEIEADIISGKIKVPDYLDAADQNGSGAGK